MSHNFIIFIRAFNDLDQIMPFIDYVLKSGGGTVQLISNSRELPGARDHLEFLERMHGIKPNIIYELIFSPFYNRILRTYGSFLDVIPVISKKIPYINLLFLTITRFYENIMRKPIIDFVNNLHDSNVLLMDFGSERSFPNKVIVKYAKKRSIPITCFAHGYFVWTNLDNTVKSRLRRNPKRVKIENMLSGKRHYADRYLTCAHQRDTYYRSSSSGAFDEHWRVKEIGAPRFTREWSMLFKTYLMRKINFQYGDPEKLNVVFFISHFQYNVISEMFFETFHELGKLDNINFVYKPHTRGGLAGIDESELKGFNAVDIPSIILSDWADIGILYGTSIGFQLLLDKVPIIIPTFIHTNHTIFEKFHVCITAGNIQELKNMLSHDKENIGNFFDHEKSNKFINDILYGNRSYQQLMQAYYDAAIG